MSDKKISISLLSLFILIYGINAYFSYKVNIVGDEYMYMQSAKDLLQGKLTFNYPLFDEIKQAFPDHENPLIQMMLGINDRLVSWYTIGITIVFAFLILLSGEQVFWVAPILFDIILITGLYTLTYLIAAKTKFKNPWIIALLAVALYGTIINFRLGMRRDLFIAGVTIWLGVCFYFALYRKNKFLWHLIWGALCFLTIVKITNLILFFPLILALFFNVDFKTLKWKSVLIHCAIALFVMSVVFAPMFIHNFISTGYWYLPTQHVEARGFISSESTSFLMQIAENLQRIIHTFFIALSVSGTTKWTALFTACLVALGTIKLRKEPLLRLWVIPFCITLLGLYSLTRREYYAYNVYFTLIYPYIILCSAIGLSWLIQNFSNRKTILWIVAIIIMLPFLSVKLYRSFPSYRYERFQLKQANQLREDLEEVIPEKSILLCDRFIADAIDYFCNFYCFPPGHLESTQASTERKVEYLLKIGYSVYITDYKGIENSAQYFDRLNEKFKLTLVKDDQGIYNFPTQRDIVTMDIYKIETKDLL